jgi:Tfp pilus assembly protein PilF
VRFDLGSAYFDERDWAKAVEHLQQAVKHDPDYSLAWRLLGQSQQALGHAAYARNAFENGFGAAEKYGDIETANQFRQLLDEVGP